MDLVGYRYFIYLSFDGKAYCGWQVQPGIETVQYTVETALSTILRTKTPLTGAGRTDTGVHARMYTAHFDFHTILGKDDLKNLNYKLNRILPPDISIIDIKQVELEAHARFSAFSRSYEYLIIKEKNPFLFNRAWLLERNLNIQALNEAAQILLEYDDFESFSKTNTQVKHFRCKIIHADWEEENGLLIFRISADRFLRNMVRALVGTMVDVGLGKITVDDFREIIKSKNRSKAGYSVPGFGLYFMGAEYAHSIFI
jgi:tRNA pseudouridine38-40 synthase